jgi:protein involved in polysaccharide export with SLBB domain
MGIRKIFLSFVLPIYLIAYFSVAPVMAQQQQGKFIPPSTVTSLENLQTSGQRVPATMGQVHGLSSLEESGFSALPLIKVHVLGEVSNPGIYSVPVSERLSDVIARAAPKRTSQRTVELRHPGERTRYFDLYRYFYFGDLNHNPFLKDNDVIFLSPRKGAIRVEGPVARPGLYELANEKTVADILHLAGGTTSAASTVYPIKIVRFNEDGKRSVTDVEPAISSTKSFKIKKGDIIVVPDIVNDPKKFDYSVETLPGENLFYPTATPNVFVVGAVGQAGAFPYKSHMKVGDYVAYASPTPQAQIRAVTRIRDGQRARMEIDEKPNPGDILIVKSRVSVGAIVTAVSTALSLTLTMLLLRDQLRN